MTLASEIKRSQAPRSTPKFDELTTRIAGLADIFTIDAVSPCSWTRRDTQYVRCDLQIRDIQTKSYPNEIILRQEASCMVDHIRRQCGSSKRQQISKRAEVDSRPEYNFSPHDASTKSGTSSLDDGQP